MANSYDERWVRVLWELSEKGRRPDGTHRDPSSAERKNIVRKLRNLGKPKQRPERPAPDSYAQAMKFLETLFHNGERVRNDAAFRAWLNKIQTDNPGTDLYRYLPKPWKGKTARVKRTTHANEVAERARRLRRDQPALTYRQIAERLGLEGKPKTLEQRIARYLKR